MKNRLSDRGSPKGVFFSDVAMSRTGALARMGSTFFKDRDFNRRHERKKYGASVVFTHKNRAYSGILSDISVGGAFIETPSANLFSVGDSITVSIPFTTGGKHVKRSASIIRTNDAGFAVEFD